MKNLTRRSFVKGMAATSVVAMGSVNLNAGILNQQSSKINSISDEVEVLSGKIFNLNIGKNIVNLTGNPAIATTINNSLSGPTLRWREGDEITIHVTNHLKEDTSIHWHGIILPPHMDGVPGISFDGIKPDSTFTYKFKVVQSGTYWYHSHSGFQEQTGVYGAIVIEPKSPNPYKYDRDYVVNLSDWSDEKPEKVYRKLKLKADYYNLKQRTVSDYVDDIKEKGFFGAFSSRKMWNEMSMTDRDLSDVTGATYTYLMNGKNPNSNWKAIFKANEKVLLRFVNCSAMTFFDVRIPGLKMTVVASDGNNIQPVSVDEFRIGVAETYDVIVEPKEKQAYPIFAQSLERSGYAVGSLTYDKNIEAKVPSIDEAQALTHSDMGMDMSNMDMEGMDMSSMNMNDAISNNKEDKQVAMAGMKMSKKMDMSGMNMPKKMDMAGMDMSTKMPISKMDMSQKMDMTGMHSSKKMNMSDTKKTAMNMSMNNKSKIIPITKLEEDFGPQATMRVQSPKYRLDDPGVGLRNNGRRVLTYADLKSLTPTTHDAYPDREIILRLTGNMERYMWSINGIAYEDAKPLEFKYGERLRVTYINDTMMNHPMHLHGMWSDLETGDDNYLPKKHTIIVQPGSKISFRVNVDAMGSWAFHCHLLYHMGGMFRKVRVS